MNVKQVIILRKDLNMRKGKMVAQGAHASLMAYQMHLDYDAQFKQLTRYDDLPTKDWVRLSSRHNVFTEWNDPISGYRKIALSCNSEEELLAIYKKAKEAGLVVSLVKDLGLTEFKESTYTAVCIGPHYDEDIDPITSELSLL